MVPGTETMKIIPAIYGPGPEFLFALKGSNAIAITGAVPFEKGSRMSRMRILSASGPLLLSIPVKKSERGCLLSEIRTDQIQKWQNQHWRSLFSAYGKSPFFGYYRDELEVLYLQKTEFLAEFNARILSWTLRQYYPKITLRVNLSAQPSSPESLEMPEPNRDLQKNNVMNNFRYRQVFGSEFVPALSVFDHLFCAGPNSPENRLDFGRNY